MSINVFHRPGVIRSAAALAGVLLLQPACWSESDEAQGSGVVINHATQALLGADLDSVDGTYGEACTDRAGAWSIDLGGGGLLNAPLSVGQYNTACALTMTQLHTTAGILTAVPAIPLTTTYPTSASSFGSPIQFYASARLSSLTFAGDFVVTIPYSDSSNLASGDDMTSYDVVESSATAESVSAPDYTIEAAGLALLTDPDDVVVSATGSAALTTVSVTGQTYVILEATGLITYAAIDTAYLAGTPAAVTATIPAASFVLLGDDLTTDQGRTLIMANTLSGVRSYQAFQITFHAPI
jgi:hypothetical protein